MELPTKCLGCQKELWLSDYQAGSDNEVFRRCDPCLEIMNKEMDAYDKYDRSFAKAMMIRSCMTIFAAVFFILAFIFSAAAIFYYYISKIQ